MRIYDHIEEVNTYQQDILLLVRINLWIYLFLNKEDPKMFG